MKSRYSLLLSLCAACLTGCAAETSPTPTHSLASYFSPVAETSLTHSQSVADLEDWLGIALPPVEEGLQNRWPPELEAGFRRRAERAIAHYAGKDYGNTHAENEKRSYPLAMLDFLAGNRERAIAFLQQEDVQANQHQHTAGIDYYFAFTLKGQIRKYFLFGPYLNPSYRQRMYEGAKNWTEEDPNTRPHPVYGHGDGTGKDWSIQRRGGWVDSRNTDNLQAMREVAVYLMAEETNNETVRQQYKAKLQRYVWALYHIGMGEWDSETYHSQTFAAYLNLYDFAQDSEVKALAKAALDWLSTAAAVKYYHGGWAGPVKRDYGWSNVVYGADAARFFSLYFGDVPFPNPDPTRDSLHAITSRYRPPLAVVALAKKQFPKPVEILATKPIYENWKEGGDQQPGYWETTFIGNSYQMGSIAASFPDGDVAPFKLVAQNSQRGVDYFVANTDQKWVRPGKRPGDQIGQFRNLLIWLRPADETPFFFQLPKTAKIEKIDNIWFVQLEKTWLAIHPLQLQDYQAITVEHKKYQEMYSQAQTYQVLSQPQGDYTGFALEVGEAETHGSYQDFTQAVRQKSQVDVTNLNNGRVELTGSQDNRLMFTYNPENLLPQIERNGVFLRRENHFELYRSLPQGNPIFLGWKAGTLRVEAGGHTFKTTVTEDRLVAD
ncbi:hypothetical protein PN462_00725 [Spirulina sp. CS-785/01]|uniref:hypothetical protein n=1 Tax=Spirulina sp. CS-785/01 TaxID=3021716 RepID=UPI00232AF81E|nr:hypothetical protein [Spirulina sp. CS-785/01]MDB9311605.1 hypothetical protein [Spirulina sp. CS-785/01]